MRKRHEGIIGVGRRIVPRMRSFMLISAKMDGNLYQTAPAYKTRHTWGPLPRYRTYRANSWRIHALKAF